ncbi:hypothetical protein SASPL_101501 [Salvia splendens]|uniref:Uncharacterized protein n=1 Tax=Salvia splendens TaxID=180675 RepID=A0A8X8YRT9_SALSN|nr:hypothetical protein SASPL_101501 [Salvia splendens]
MVDTRKSSTENSGHQLRSGRTSGEGNTTLKLFKDHTLNLLHLLHLIPNIDSDFCKTSSTPKKNASSAPQVPTEIPATKSTTSSAPKKNASSAPEIPHNKGKTSSPTRKNASSSEIPTGKLVTKGKTSSQKKMNASSSEIPTEIPAKKGKK